ncbi:MAG TPA: hypothetical protein ENI39_06545 [Anaerolineae bacterium]|nr:hypothetical protein [Anaerolineae bacterium]
MVLVHRIVHNQPDDVARRDDLSVHFALFWNAKAGVGELGRFDALHRDLVGADVQPLRQIGLSQCYQGRSRVGGDSGRRWANFQRRFRGPLALKRLLLALPDLYGDNVNDGTGG